MPDPDERMNPADVKGERLAKMRGIETRSRILQSVRRFFVDRHYLEVETPVRLRTPALELHIDAEPSGDWFLRTSPELHMKRMVADGYERIFQMGPCFRRGERGRFHRPEYTMLEWYQSGGDYLDALTTAKALLTTVVRETLGTESFSFRGARIDITPVWECFTIREAFLEWAGWDPVRDFDADRFDLDLNEKVEPHLPADRPVVLKDYPAQAAALARCRADAPPVAERWELYLGGIELANAFSELTDPVQQRERFESWAAERRQAGRDVYPLDEAFLASLEKGMPACAGVALGIDRLAMVLTDSSSVDDVNAFAYGG